MTGVLLFFSVIGCHEPGADSNRDIRDEKIPDVAIETHGSQITIISSWFKDHLDSNHNTSTGRLETVFMRTLIDSLSRYRPEIESWRNDLLPALSDTTVLWELVLSPAKSESSSVCFLIAGNHASEERLFLILDTSGTDFYIDEIRVINSHFGEPSLKMEVADDTSWYCILSTHGGEGVGCQETLYELYSAQQGPVHKSTALTKFEDHNQTLKIETGVLFDPITGDSLQVRYSIRAWTCTAVDKDALPVSTPDAWDTFRGAMCPYTEGVLFLNDTFKLIYYYDAEKNRYQADPAKSELGEVQIRLLQADARGGEEYALNFYSVFRNQIHNSVVANSAERSNTITWMEERLKFLAQER